MKRILLIVSILLLGCGTVVSQSCLQEGIAFNTQVQIDNFQTNNPDCTEIEGWVLVIGGDITNLNELNVLEAIGEDLYIMNTAVLTNLSGLNNVTSIGGDLYIGNNAILTSLTGLDNIEAASINNLTISYNSTLSTCEAQSICDYLDSPNGTVEIHNNASGCSTQKEVEIACIGVNVENMIPDEISIFPNPASNLLTISSQDGTIEEIIIYNLSVQIVLHQDSPSNTITISHIHPGMYFIEVVTEKSRIREKLIIQ